MDLLAFVLIQAAAAPDATAIVVAIGGLLQPYVQELLVRSAVTGRKAALLTFGVSLLVALLATYVTGGFAGTQLPAFTLADPSPLLAYLWPKWASVYALSQLVYFVTPEKVGSVPTSPTAVAGT